MSESRSKVKANKFVKAADSDVVDRLSSLAKIIVRARRLGIKPNKLSGSLDQLFHRNFAELNPLSDLDNYGLEQLLAKLAGPSDIKGIKSYYKSALDAWLAQKTGTMSELHQMIKEELEEVVGEHRTWLNKVESFLESTADEAADLAAEGSEMVAKEEPGVFGKVAVLKAVGLLTKMSNLLSQSLVSVKKT